MYISKTKPNHYRKINGYYVSNLTEKEIAIMDKLYEAGEVKNLKNTLKGKTLMDFQTLSPALAYIAKRFVFGSDTGLGKSLMISTYMKIHKDKGSVNKFLVVTTNSSVNQIHKTIYETTGIKLLYLPGDANGIVSALSDPNLYDYDGYIVASSAFSKSVEFARYFNYLIDDINVFIFDESMDAANPDSIIHNSIKWWIKNCEYRLLCNATIIEKSIDQLYYQFELLDPNLLPPLSQLKREHEVKKEIDGKKKVVAVKGVDTLLESLKYRYHAESRVARGLKMEYEDYMVPVSPTVLQERVATSTNYEWAFFSPTTQRETSVIPFDRANVPSLDALVQVVGIARKDGPMVIYAEPIACKDVIRAELRKEYPGIVVSVIDGNTVETRDMIREAFNRNEIDVLIINIPEALDLVSGRSIIFLTLPSKHYQARGRIERSLSTSDYMLKFYYIIYMHRLQLNYIKGTFQTDEITLDSSLKRGIVTARKMVKKINQLESTGYVPKGLQLFKL